MDDQINRKLFFKTKISISMFRHCFFRNCKKRNIPQLVIYKLNYFTELIARLFIKIKFANILNILWQNKMIIPEITNSNLNPKNIFIKQFKNLI